MNSSESNSPFVLFDANTLQNFAVVDRLDLLQVCYGDRAGWAEAVQFEIRMGVQSETRLRRVLSQSRLGEPIPVEGAEAILAVEMVRRGVGGVVAHVLRSILARPKPSSSWRLVIGEVSSSQMTGWLPTSPGAGG